MLYMSFKNLRKNDSNIKQMKNKDNNYQQYLGMISNYRIPFQVKCLQFFIAKQELKPK